MTVAVFLEHVAEGGPHFDATDGGEDVQVEYTRRRVGSVARPARTCNRAVMAESKDMTRMGLRRALGTV